MSSDSEDIRVRIEHIMESAEFLRVNLGNLAFDRFLENQVLLMASLYSLQTAGEASIAIPAKFKDERPEFPWQDMRRMRNVIAHEYYKVDLSVVWNAIHNHFLPLEQDFRTLLDSLPEDGQ